MTGREHRALHVARVALSVTLVLVSVTLFWLVRPYDNISFTPFRTDAATYAPGAAVTLTTEQFCWDGTPFLSERFYVSRVSRISAGTVEFPDGFAVPAVAAKYAATGCATTTVRLDLPHSMPAGEWSVVFRASYRANPIRVVSVENTSNTFTVRKATP